jgi:hypothetical protein
VLDGTSLPAGERAGTVLPGQASPDDARDEITNYPDAFEGCLRVHLEKVEGLGSAHADFVRRAFPDDFVGVLCDRAAELIERCGDSDEGQQLDLNRSGVHYALCVLPEEMENAGEWFGRVHGGYARFLAGLLDAWATAERTCSTICVITFGMVEAAWISVTVLPAQRDADGADIEIMSFEFLSEEERARAVSLDIADVGRGL